MKFLCIGDPHITHKSLDRAQVLFDLVESVGLPTVWLGDFLDTKEVIRGKCLNALIEYLSRSKLQHNILIGNHDWFNLECKAHALEALKLLPNVLIVDKPMMVHTGIAMMPYIHDKQVLEQALKTFQDKDVTLFAHLEVTNFDFGNGHICTSGISLKTLDGYKRVISGHFHKFQQLANLTYLGTPFSHSFGETDQIKFLGMYDDSVDELILAETPFPKHVTYEINCDIENPELPILDHTNDNFVRIILNGTQENIDVFPKSIFTAPNIKWISRPSNDIVNNVNIDETASNEVQFQKWATQIRNMDVETIKLGMAILESCK